MIHTALCPLGAEVTDLANITPLQQESWGPPWQQASHLALHMSLHLNKLQLSVKWATNSINAEWENDCKPPLPRAVLFPSSLISSCNLLFPSLSFQLSVSPLPPSLSECLIIFFCLCWAWRGVFSAGGATQATGSASRMGGGICPACLTDLHRSRPFSFPKLSPACPSLFQHRVCPSCCHLSFRLKLLLKHRRK